MEIVSMTLAIKQDQDFLSPKERKKYLHPWREIFRNYSFTSHLQGRGCRVTIIGKDLERLRRAMIDFKYIKVRLLVVLKFHNLDDRLAGPDRSYHHYERNKKLITDCLWPGWVERYGQDLSPYPFFDRAQVKPEDRVSIAIAVMYYEEYPVRFDLNVHWASALLRRDRQDTREQLSLPWVAQLYVPDGLRAYDDEFRDRRNPDTFERLRSLKFSTWYMIFGYSADVNWNNVESWKESHPPTPDPLNIPSPLASITPIPRLIKASTMSTVAMDRNIEKHPLVDGPLFIRIGLMGKHVIIPTFVPLKEEGQLKIL
jgi:hypothetical protein